MSNARDSKAGDHPADVPSDPPAVASPGDGDAPDTPDAETVYPDEQGVPGEPDDE